MGAREPERAHAAEPVLRARGLQLGYGSRAVLTGVDFEIRPGEFWFLIGPNGSGKSTLLKAILGRLQPWSGRLERHPRLARRERLGFVPQDCALHPTLPTTVREFVSLGFVGSSVARRERARNLTWALACAGLTGLELVDYWSLSGGQRQRALVARALVRRPGLMILDEPTEGLDVTTEDALLETLLELNRCEGLTLLLVTHELTLAARYASHIALFDRGQVLTGPRARIAGADIERVFGVALDLDRAAAQPRARGPAAGEVPR